MFKGVRLTSLNWKKPRSPRYDIVRWADSIGIIICTNCIASDLNRSIVGQDTLSPISFTNNNQITIAYYNIRLVFPADEFNSIRQAPYTDNDDDDDYDDPTNFYSFSNIRISDLLTSKSNFSSSILFYLNDVVSGRTTNGYAF